MHQKLSAHEAAPRLGLITVVVKVVGAEIVGVGITIGLGLFIFEVQLYRVKADNRQACSAIVAGDVVTLFALGINVNFFAAFGTDRCWHGGFLRNLWLIGLIYPDDGRDDKLINNLT